MASQSSSRQVHVQNYGPELFQSRNAIPVPPGYARLALKPAIKRTIQTVETVTTVHFDPVLVPKPAEPPLLTDVERARQHSLPYQSFPALSTVNQRQGPNHKFDPKVYPLAKTRSESVLGDFKMRLGPTEASYLEDTTDLEGLYARSPPVASTSMLPTPSQTRSPSSSPAAQQRSPPTRSRKAYSPQSHRKKSQTERLRPQAADPLEALQPPRKKSKSEASPRPATRVTSPPTFTANQMPSPVASPRPSPSPRPEPYASPPDTSDENSQPPRGTPLPIEAAGVQETTETKFETVALDLGSGLELTTLMSLPSLVEHFSALPNNLQSHVLFNLLRRAPVPVLQLVNSLVTPALKRDFICDLPPEISVLVLSHLDGTSLCKATLVSRRWHRIIDSDGRIWKRRMQVEGFWIGDGSEQREAVAIETGTRFLTKDELFLKRWTEGVWDPEFDTRQAAWTASKKIEAARYALRGALEDVFMVPGQDDLSLEQGASERNYGKKPLNVPLTMRKTIDAHGHYTHPYKLIYRSRFLTHRNWSTREPRRLSFAGNGNNVVTALQFDKKRVIAASDDHSINVYSMNRLGLIAQLDGHDGGVWCLAYVGDVLVSGSTDRTVRVWDMANHRCSHIFLGHTSTVRCLQIIDPINVNPDPDGPPVWEPPYPLVVTGSRDSTLRVWKLPMPGIDRDYLPFVPLASPDTHGAGDGDTDNPFHLRVLLGHKNAVRALSGTGRVMVSGSYDCNVRVWDILSGECLQILRGHKEKVYSVVYDGRRQQCASGSMDGTVKLWSTRTGQCLRSLDGHSSLVGLLGLSQHHLVSAAADSTLRVWDAATGRCKSVLSAHSGAITCFQHDDYKVVSGSDGTLKMWNTRTGAYIRDLLGNLSGVWQVAFDERFCVAAVQRNGISEYNILDFGRTDGLDGMSFDEEVAFTSSPDEGDHEDDSVVQPGEEAEERVSGSGGGPNVSAGLLVRRDPFPTHDSPLRLRAAGQEVRRWTERT